jgi:hypothetical protein
MDRIIGGCDVFCFVTVLYGETQTLETPRL